MTTIEELKQTFIDTYAEWADKETKENSFGIVYTREDAEDYALDLEPTGEENVEELRTVLAFAKKEKEHFDMTSWVTIPERENTIKTYEPLSCGTTMCLAGTAAYFSLQENEVISSWGEIYSYDRDTETRGNLISGVETRGRNVLGLTWGQADILFALPDDLAVVEAAMNLVAGEILLPADES